MKRAAVYCRVSSPKQVKEGYSLEWQIDNMPLHARASGSICTEDDIFIEPGISGTNDDRPEYNKLMARIVEGYYQEVWVVEKSRLSRTEDRGEEQQIVEALQKFGCLIRTPGTTFDVSTLEGEFFNDIDSAVNRMERKRIKYRMETGKIAKIQKGGYTGGNPPTGYKRQHDPITGKVHFVIDPERAEMVKLAFKLCLTGHSINSIHHQLFSLGYRNSKGGRIPPTSVLNWLKNPHYAGYTHLGHGYKSYGKKKILIEKNDYMEPIISKDDFAQVAVILESRSQGKRSHFRHPLSGIILCPSCNGRMQYDIQRGRMIYVCGSKLKHSACSGKQSKQIDYEKAHVLILEMLPRLFEQLDRKYSITQKAKKIAAKNPDEQNQKRLETTLTNLKRKIMKNIEQQEEEFSEFRKIRIGDLELEYKLVEKELEAFKKKGNVTQLPHFLGFSEYAKALKSDNVTQLGQLFPMIFKEIRWKRLEPLNQLNYKLTSIVLTTGHIARDNGRTGWQLQGP